MSEANLGDGTRPRRDGRGVVGFFLSFVVIGGGHVIVGRWRRGAVLVAGVLLIFLSIPWTRAVGMFGALALYLFIPFDLKFIAYRQRRDWGRDLAVVAGLFVLLLTFRNVVRHFYVEAFKIPVAGMAPTLVPGDHIFVAKYDRDVTRGDVIVFEHPREPEKDFIERVVGVAGDRIEVRSGRLIVNGTAAAKSTGESCKYFDRDERTGRPAEQTAMCVEEALGQARYTVALSPDGSGSDFPGDGTAPYVVPPDSLFVMGDNRENSADSRSWGPVPRNRVKGTALFIWWAGRADGGSGLERVGAPIR
jgi:signal peptidase I